jgi:hypothetical protein
LQAEKQQMVIYNKIESQFSRVTIAYSTIIYWRKKGTLLYSHVCYHCLRHVYSRKTISLRHL